MNNHWKHIRNYKDRNTNPALDDYEYDEYDFRVKDFEKVFCEETERSSMVKDKNKGNTSILYNHLNLPIEIQWSSTKKIEYLYNAAGGKVQKKVTNGVNIKTTDYLDGFQYNEQVLEFFPTAEGYVKATPIGNANPDLPPTGYAYNYTFNYTDHLGNIRLSYTKDPQSGTLQILEENHYYPFGLRHEVYVTGSKRQHGFGNDGGGGDIDDVELINVLRTDYQYKYNGKEFQDELGMNIYDYGARNYDPAIGRWMNVDPLAEKFVGTTSYSYVANNPMVFFDPDGKDVYRYDNKTGDLKLMEKRDGLDVIGNYKKKDGEYVLRTDRKGEMKTLVDDIAKGILHDGINFRENNNTIAVNGTNTDGTKQATTDDVLEFIVDFANNIAGKEISGYAMGEAGKDNETNILVEKFKGNSHNFANSSIFTKNQLIPKNIHNAKNSYFNARGFSAKFHFHTHLDNGNKPPKNFPSEGKSKDTDHKKETGGLLHYIINSNGKYKF